MTSIARGSRFPPQQQGFGGFGGPPQQQGFGGFGGGYQPTRQRFNPMPQQQQGFGGFGGGFSMPQQQQNFGGFGGFGGGFSMPQQQQNFGGFGGFGMPQQQGFGGYGMLQQQGFGGYGMPQQGFNQMQPRVQPTPPQQQQGGSNGGMYQIAGAPLNEMQQFEKKMRQQQQLQTGQILGNPYSQQMGQEDPRMQAMRNLQQMGQRQSQYEPMVSGPPPGGQRQSPYEPMVSGPPPGGYNSSGG
jgi:hypothetical protein